MAKTVHKKASHVALLFPSVLEQNHKDSFLSWFHPDLRHAYICQIYKRNNENRYVLKECGSHFTYKLEALIPY